MQEFFQSYLSPIQTTASLAPGNPSLVFQSYLSPIQTVVLHNPQFHRVTFQSYLSPIQTPPTTTASVRLCLPFNPTLVQFKLR